MGLVYVVAHFAEDADSHDGYNIMRDMQGNGAFESIDEAAALMERAEASGVFDGWFRIIGLNVKGEF